MKKRWMLIGIAISMVSLLGFFLISKIDAVTAQRLIDVSIDEEAKMDFQLSLSGRDHTIKEVSNEINDKEQSYGVYKGSNQVGQLFVEHFALAPTGDYYYFIKYNPFIDADIPLQIKIRLKTRSTEVVERHILYAFDQSKQQPILAIPNSTWSEPAKIASGYGLPKQALFMNGQDFSMHLNKINVYQSLGNGVRKERFDLTPPIQYLKDKGGEEFIISLPQVAGKEIEQWGIIGKEGMVNWGDKEQERILLVANLDRVRKWTQGGVQYVTPETYHPYDPRGFWIVPAQHVGNKLLLEGNNRFSTNFALLSLQAALRTQTEGGYWISSPRSTWLFGDYGIDAGFYDTRFNTDAGLFLLYGYRQLGEEKYLLGATRYGDFLIEYAEKHHHTTKNGGYLVYDYTHGEDMDQKTETLTSLNHLITEMNFLYELYIETNQRDYLNTAEKMRQAVKDTRLNWRKNDGDLWYAYLPDGSYGLQDYPLLTLKDLRYSQKLIEKIHGKADSDFQYLIELKEKYLNSKGLPLYD